VNIVAKVIDNNFTTDDFTVFIIICSALLIGIAIYFQR
jgi:hypothetical protein